MNAIILSIGDELCLGQTVDTNSAWVSKQLAAVGCDVIGHATVSDDQQAIEEAIRNSAAKVDVLIVSGGLGPTDDDLTRQALAAVVGTPLELNQAWFDHMQAFFTKLGRTMPVTNKIQAMIPAGATMIWNTNGTAAGLSATLGKCKIFVVPGVPKEMKAMITRDVLPPVKEAAGGAAIVSATLHTFGAGESTVAERLGDLMKRGRNPSVGTTVSGGIVSLRLNSRFGSPAEATAELETTAAACREKLGDLIFGQDEDTLPSIVSKLLKNEGEKPITVATAESCTGGLLAKMLTDLPGSSAYFSHGWVTYSNFAKHERLGVSTEVLNVYGAVSEHVVEQMAKAARRLSKSDYALAISGIAGPDGGSATKPVGTVCIALASPDPADKAGSLFEARTFQFSGDREMIRDRSAKMALAMLRFKLLGKKMPF